MTIAQTILRPIRAFREDLRTNPLSRLTWGIEPWNYRRQLKAISAVLFPPLLLCGILSLFLFGFFPLPFIGRVAISKIHDPQEFLLPCLLLLVYGIHLWLPVVLIARSVQVKSMHKLRANRDDYQLAGLTGRQMIWAATDPWSLGLVAALIPHGVASLALTIYIVVHEGMSDDDTWLTFVILYGPVFSMLACSVLDAAMLMLTTHVVLRLFALIFIGLLTSPILLWLVGVTMSIWSIESIALYGEIISWPLRLWLVVWLWRKAVRRLESGEFGGAA